MSNTRSIRAEDLMEGDQLANGRLVTLVEWLDHPHHGETVDVTTQYGTTVYGTTYAPKTICRGRQVSQLDAFPATVDKIQALAAATGGGNPMRRDDYRRPIRAAMLHHLKWHALVERGASPAAIHALTKLPIREWPDQARAQLRKPLHNNEVTS